MKIDTEGTYTLTYTATDSCGNSTSENRTVVVASPRTVLYTDGTFIINEQPEDRAANVAAHGEATNTYIPFTPGAGRNHYVFGSNNDVFWHSVVSSVLRVEVGEIIHPLYMDYWFNGMNNCTSIDLSNVRGDEVRSMRNTFALCQQIAELDLSNFETTDKLEDLYMTFYRCRAITSLDVSKFNTINVNEMSGTFKDCRNLITIYASNNFVTDNAQLSVDMFTTSTKLVGGAGTRYNSSHIDKEYARIDNPPDAPGYFTLKPSA